MDTALAIVDCRVYFQAVKGFIARRLLLNYRVRPEVMAELLPEPFSPLLINGYGLAGVCIIRLENLRPRLLPAFVGLSSENAGYRFAIQWQESGETKQGVYLPRRDSGSWFNTIVGGRLFPGVHHPVDFTISKKAEELSIKIESQDGMTDLEVSGSVATEFTQTSIFGSLKSISDFFEMGNCGFSDGRNPRALDGIKLCTDAWKTEPFKVNHIRSSFFDSQERFPEGSIEFDSALYMHDIEHQWQRLHPLATAPKKSQRL